MIYYHVILIIYDHIIVLVVVVVVCLCVCGTHNTFDQQTLRRRRGPWWPPQRLARWRAGRRPHPVKMKVPIQFVGVVGSICDIWFELIFWIRIVVASWLDWITCIFIYWSLVCNIPGIVLAVQSWHCWKTPADFKQEIDPLGVTYAISQYQRGRFTMIYQPWARGFQLALWRL